MVPLLFLQKLLCVVVLALLCVYVVRCALRSHQWRSEQSLFTSALSVCPLNAKVKKKYIKKSVICAFPPRFSLCQ